MTAARRVYTAADVKAASDRAVQEFSARQKEGEIEKFMESHTELHAHLEDALNKIERILDSVIVVVDPDLRERAPDLLKRLNWDREHRGERRQFWIGWKGRVAVIVSIGGFVMIALTSFGVLPPKPQVVAPGILLPSPTPSLTP